MPDAIDANTTMANEPMKTESRYEFIESFIDELDTDELNFARRYIAGYKNPESDGEKPGKQDTPDSEFRADMYDDEKDF